MTNKVAAQFDLMFKAVGSPELRDMQTQLQALGASYKNAQDEIARLTGKMDPAVRQTQRLTKAANDNARAFKNAGGAGGIQNFGYQIQDFATQVGAGTSAVQSLGQQLPQLLSGFGALGVVAGAFVAIAIPVGRVLLDIRDYSKEAADALQALGDAQGTLGTNLDELNLKYGEFAKTIRDIAAAQVSINAEKVTQALRDQAQAATEASAANTFYTRFFDAMAQSGSELAAIFETVGNSIANSFGDTEIFSQQANNLAKFRSDFSLTAENAKLFGDEYLKIQAALAQGEFATAADLIATFTANVNASSSAIRADMLPVLNAFETQMKSLGEAIAATASTASSMGFSFTPKWDTRGQIAAEAGLGKVREQLAELERPAAEAEKAAAEAKRASATAAREAAAALDTYRKSLEGVRTPLEQTTAKLNEAQANLRKFGKFLSPEELELAKRQIDELNAKIAELSFEGQWQKMSAGIAEATTALGTMQTVLIDIGKEMQDQFVTGLTDAFISFVDGTKSAKEAFKDFAVSFLKEVAKMILQTAILYFIKQAAGMITGGMGGGFGGLGGIGASIYSGSGGGFGLPAIAPLSAGLHTRDGAPQPMVTSIQPIGRQFNTGSIIPATGGGMAKMRSEPQKVTINNYAGVEVKTRQMPDEMVIEIATKRAKAEMTSDLRRGGNPLANAMEGAYAVRRAGR
jgi:hypothetical protein